MSEIEHDKNFPSWEAEKEWKIDQLRKLSDEVNELGSFLRQFGIQGETIHSKFNKLVDTLIKTGVLTEKQVLDMEYSFAQEMVSELEEAAAEVRKQAALRGMPIPDQKSSGLIVPGS